MSAYVLYALSALVLINLCTILSFWEDKQRAKNGERRIPESDLLSLAMFGGSPGALLARRLFRHKTRKEPFSTQLLVIVALQLGAAIGLVIAFA